jgi:hypothetical protein
MKTTVSKEDFPVFLALAKKLSRLSDTPEEVKEKIRAALRKLLDL